MRKLLITLCLLLFFFIPLPAYAAEVKEVTGIAVIDADSLNVRSGPSKDYDKLGTLARNISVQVKGFVEPDWYLIDFEGADGYINSEYVIFTPQEMDEVESFFIPKKYLIMLLVVTILILSGILVYTFVGIRTAVDEDVEEEIPVTSHDDTNMHLGEVSYDTYRLDIDPKYFEQTTAILQPESIYDDRKESVWKKDLFGEESIKDVDLKKQAMSEEDLQALDSKLEQATAQIAALQKEVEQLKKQRPDSI